MSYICVYHFATSLVLYLSSTVPLVLYFILNTHLQPMIILSLEKKGNFHV